jgi:hypothetical protein
LFFSFFFLDFGVTGALDIGGAAGASAQAGLQASHSFAALFFFFLPFVASDDPLCLLSRHFFLIFFLSPRQGKLSLQNMWFYVQPSSQLMETLASIAQEAHEVCAGSKKSLNPNRKVQSSSVHRGFFSPVFFFFVVRLPFRESVRAARC